MGAISKCRHCEEQYGVTNELRMADATCFNCGGLLRASLREIKSLDERRNSELFRDAMNRQREMFAKAFSGDADAPRFTESTHSNLMDSIFEFLSKRLRL